MIRARLYGKVVNLIIGALIAAPWLAFVSASDPKLIRPPLSVQYAPLYHRYLFTDFDGDRAPDEAEMYSAGHNKDIRIRLSSFRVKSISFDSGSLDPGKLVSGDIDRDNDQDMVWGSAAGPKTVFFWINDGKGNFGAAIRYRQSDPRPDLDLRPLLSQDAGPGFSGQWQGNGKVYAQRPDDSPVIELALWRKIRGPARLPILQTESHLIQSASLKTILKRGPPAQLY